MAEPLPNPPEMIRLPLRISPDKRRILDADGQPVLLQGDTAWSLIANTTLDGARQYLENRREKGFNAVIISLIEYLFSKDPPRNLAGDEPFDVPGDFRTPNERYMAHAERVIEIAEQNGLLVFLAPAYLGYPNATNAQFHNKPEGWYEEVLANGVDGCRAWGDYLGRRFGRFKNIVWMIGGDRNPGLVAEPLNQLALAIKATGVDNLFTAHVFPECSPADVFPDHDWLDLVPTYTYAIVHHALIEDWKRLPVRPIFLIESSYEGERNAPEQQIRRQAYWSVLCGGNGHFFGNYPIWLLWDGWAAAMELPGSIAMVRWGDYFRGIDFAALEPDLERRIGLDGLGEMRGLDRVTVASTPDRRLTVAYLPVHRALNLALGELSGPHLEVEWFEPATGRRVSGGTLVAEGRATLVPPFPEDSVLKLTSIE